MFKGPAALASRPPQVKLLFGASVTDGLKTDKLHAHWHKAHLWTHCNGFKSHMLHTHWHKADSGNSH